MSPRPSASEYVVEGRSAESGDRFGGGVLDAPPHEARSPRPEGEFTTRPCAPIAQLVRRRSRHRLLLLRRDLRRRFPYTSTARK
ncbi:hypothetical protein [Streptomyces sp. NPDC054842]